MPEGSKRVFDEPGRLAQLTADSVITNGIQIDVLEVQRGDEVGAGLALYVYGRPNNVAEGRYEKLHILGLDVAAKLTAALLVVGTNTWGQKFSGPIDSMISDPKTIPGMVTEAGIVLPGPDISAIRKRRGR